MEYVATDPLPKFSYVGQISEGEIVTEYSYLLLVLNERAPIAGVVIEFKNCADIEVDLVIEQVFKIAYQIIDFDQRLKPKELPGVLNWEGYYVTH